MTMNKCMHPRNIYRTPPDFTDLAIKYPEFREVSKIDLDGKVKLDFYDKNTVRILTKCLLLKDFGLDVKIPQEKLIPTLPLRLNYILWIEDIFHTFQMTKLSGVDIGCGASCIYALLAVKTNDWKMHVLETNDESFKYAVENINKNNLSDKITAYYQKNNTEMFSALFCEQNSLNFDFSICNPPFFASLDDLNYNINKNRTGKRKRPKNTISEIGCSHELVVEGGEIEFIKNMINDSLKQRDKISVYTTMLGHKSSVNIILKYLQTKEITNITQTEFCQGNTSRWGIGWSFRSDLILKNVPKSSPINKHINSSHSIKFIVPENDTTLNTSADTLRKILEKLCIKIKVLEITQNAITWEIVAEQNTWSHQRRKRRELIKVSTPICENKLNLKTEQTFSADEKHDKEHDIVMTNVAISFEKQQFLVAGLNLHKNKEQIELDIGYLVGVGGKDSVHQIMQFIINNWKK